MMVLTDEEILAVLRRHADKLDATRVHETRKGEWHATTIFDGDAAVLAFARALIAEQEKKTIQTLTQSRTQQR